MSLAKTTHGADEFIKNYGKDIERISKQTSSLSKLAPDLPTGPLTIEQKQQQQLELLKVLQEVARRGGQGQGEIGGLKGLGVPVVPGQNYKPSTADVNFGLTLARRFGPTALKMAEASGISHDVIQKEMTNALKHVDVPPGTEKKMMSILEESRKSSQASDPLKTAALASDTGTLKRTPGMIDAVPLKTAALAPGAPLKPIGTSTPVTGSLKRTPTPVTGASPLKRSGSGFGSSTPGTSSLKRSGKTSGMSSAPKMKF